MSGGLQRVAGLAIARGPRAGDGPRLLRPVVRCLCRLALANPTRRPRTSVVPGTYPILSTTRAPLLLSRQILT